MNRGDKVSVRLHTGEVVEAAYIEPSGADPMYHRVDAGINNAGFEYLIACRIASSDYGLCRFVGPSCVMEPL